MRDETKRNIRVGLFAAAAFVVLAIAILTIGDRRGLFIRHTRYETSFRNVTGLKNGAPVMLNGVTVGYVERIELPVAPEEERIQVRFTLDAAYTERIREDTRVSIKTIGLLGDKYLELRGGSAGSPRVLEGGLVEGRDPAEFSEFVTSGEDLMENLLAISSSLKVVLRRVEAGEGLIGELTTAPDARVRLIQNTHETLATFRRLLEGIEQGRGLAGRILRDNELAETLLSDIGESARSVRTVTSTLSQDLGHDDSVYAAIMRDPSGAKLIMEAVQALHDGSQALAAATEELATGEGTLPRLLQDREYADDFLEDLRGLMENLRSASDKLDSGEGTAGALINDPQMYQDLENVVRGVSSSKVVSWFIRNRRKKGEKVAAREAEEQARAQAHEEAYPAGSAP